MATVMQSSRSMCSVGFSMPRYDAPDNVVGKTRYVDDLILPGMLHARLLRSPHAHARIESIDTSKAKALQARRAAVGVAGSGAQASAAASC